LEVKTTLLDSGTPGCREKDDQLPWGTLKIDKKRQKLGASNLPSHGKTDKKASKKTSKIGLFLGHFRENQCFSVKSSGKNGQNRQKSIKSPKGKGPKNKIKAKIVKNR